MSKPINISSSNSNISLDSLERDFTRKTSMKDEGSEDNVDTILVPFYEQDVLMKVPKEQKNKRGLYRQGRCNDKMLLDPQNSSYLINKQKARRTTYLEMFRKQITPHKKVEKKPIEHEIRSISPEVGDTERESINEDTNNPIPEFYNTEPYNEMYYEQLMTRDINNYLDNSYEEMQYTEDANIRPPQDMLIENLRSVSEVSQPRRHVRRATIDPPLDNVKLGGLGPDVERIKPRLDRARSLQRYSEKVRMENRLKIYKKSVQTEKEKKLERETSPKQRHTGQEKEQAGQKDDPNASYLLNKPNQQKSTRILHNLYSKSKSADPKKSRVENPKPLISRDLINITNTQMNDNKHTAAKNRRSAVCEGLKERRAKSNTRNKGINTEISDEVPPVQINFMVNVGGLRPSSTLKSLEEKHRMFQERVKHFKMESSNL